MFPHLVSYVTNIDGIVVSNTSCVTVLVVGVLPRLFEKQKKQEVESKIEFDVTAFTGN